MGIDGPLAAHGLTIALNGIIIGGTLGELLGVEVDGARPAFAIEGLQAVAQCLAARLEVEHHSLTVVGVVVDVEKELHYF